MPCAPMVTLEVVVALMMTVNDTENWNKVIRNCKK
jgi:hypothetical protein